MKTKFIMYILFLPTVLLAQLIGTISGIITDAATGEALPGVNIIIRDTDIGAATGPDGKFEIRNAQPGYYTLTVSMMGYKETNQTVNVKLNRTSNITVALQPKILDMQQIEVTVEPDIQDLRKAPEAIVVIDANQIRSKAMSLERVLDKAAGLHIF